MALLRRHRARTRRRSTGRGSTRSRFTDWSGFIEAILLALFIYWGWDTCLALNEETKDPKRIPGRAALLTTVILLVTYVGVTVAAMMYAGLGETGTGLGNEANADDFFLAIKDGLLGPCGWVLVVAVHDLGDLVDADHDPPDRARHARDGGVQGAAEAVRDRAPAVQDARRSRRS